MNLGKFLLWTGMIRNEPNKPKVAYIWHPLSWIVFILFLVIWPFVCLFTEEKLQSPYWMKEFVWK